LEDAFFAREGAGFGIFLFLPEGSSQAIASSAINAIIHLF